MSCSGTCTETKYEIDEKPGTHIPKNWKANIVKKEVTKNKPKDLKEDDIPAPKADVDKQGKKGVDMWIKKNLTEAKCEDKDCSCDTSNAKPVIVWTGPVKIPVEWIESQLGGIEVTYTVLVTVDMNKIRITGECVPNSLPQDTIKLGKG
jgi:hypothetical protein